MIPLIGNEQVVMLAQFFCDRVPIALRSEKPVKYDHGLAMIFSVLNKMKFHDTSSALDNSGKR
jgi:hypothetical protein